MVDRSCKFIGFIGMRYRVAKLVSVYDVNCVIALVVSLLSLY